MSPARTNEGAGRTVLVTGASAGIGKALTRVLAEHGFNGVVNQAIAGICKLLPDSLQHEVSRRQGRPF